MKKRSSTDNRKRVSEKIGELLSAKYGELVVLVALSLLGILFTIIFYSIGFTDYLFRDIERGELSFWSVGKLYFIDPLSGGTVSIGSFSVLFIIAFVVEVVLLVAAALVMLFKKRRTAFYVSCGYGLGLSAVSLIVGVTLGIMRGGAIACSIISAFFYMAAVAFMLFRRRYDEKPVNTDSQNPQPAAPDEYKAPPLSLATYKMCKIAMLVCSCVAFVALIVSFFIPLYSYSIVSVQLYISPLSSDAPVYVSAAFIVMLLAFFAETFYFASAVAVFFTSGKEFARQSRKFVISAAVYCMLFFVAGYCMTFIINIIGKPDSVYTISYIPLIISAVALLAHSVFFGISGGDNAAKRKRKPLKAEPLIFELVMTAITFVSLALKIVQVHIDSGVGYKNDVSLDGYKLLSAYKNLESGFQVLAFLEFACLLLSGIMLCLSAVSYFAKDKNYYKIVKAGAVCNFFFVLLLGLFGIYFNIAQSINMQNIESLLKYYGVGMPETATYDVKSQTIYMLVASFVTVALMMIRGIFSLDVDKAEAADRADGAGSPRDNAGDKSNASANAAATAAGDKAASDFDPCPAFTELDGRQDEYLARLEGRRQKLFASPTLPELVRFVVDYARECRIHLSYTPETIATFVAGMGASRLAILQGMSGTGKTSLPKIFAEALMGNCEIVEVESSWRDKNELLGYYNEFSKCFTPKKFTQCLYRAKLNPSVLTFIVLDEMNLSRIEYYFSDFLSLMENEEDKREIKLLNVKLARTENGQAIPYDGLTDGHTIKIPPNVWFIGTANRDESTFEISDKVYDRAQTMNFNKRAPKILSFTEPIEQRFVPYDSLVGLFAEAKSGYKFDAENNRIIQKAEKLLAPYNISFGNRVLRQIEDFVKIYCSCFGDKAAAENDAVEKILLSKVVSKLENKIVENKDTLAAEFDKLGLKACGSFVRMLNED